MVAFPVAEQSCGRYTRTIRRICESPRENMRVFLPLFYRLLFATTGFGCELFLSKNLIEILYFGLYPLRILWLLCVPQQNSAFCEHSAAVCSVWLLATNSSCVLKDHWLFVLRVVT